MSTARTPSPYSVHPSGPTISYPASVSIHTGGSSYRQSLSIDQARQLAHDLLAAIGDRVTVPDRTAWIVEPNSTKIYRYGDGTLVGYAQTMSHANDLVTAHNASLTSVPPAPVIPDSLTGKLWRLGHGWKGTPIISVADQTCAFVGNVSTDEAAQRIIDMHNASLGWVPLAPPVVAPTPPATPAAVKPWHYDQPLARVRDSDGKDILTYVSLNWHTGNLIAKAHNDAIGYTPPPAKDWADLAADDLKRCPPSYPTWALAAVIRKHAPTS